MVNKENIQSVEREGEKKKATEYKSKAQQILKQETLNHEIYSIDLKEFVLTST